MNALLQESLLNTKHINHAAIVKRRDGVVKASSPHMQIHDDEFKQIEKAFDSPREARKSHSLLRIMAMDYRPVRVDDMSIYGVKEQNGLIISRTKSYYIIGTYNPDMIPSIAAEAVEKLGEYFRHKDK